jgi:phosphomannomutase
MIMGPRFADWSIAEESSGKIMYDSAMNLSGEGWKAPGSTGSELESILLAATEVLHIPSQSTILIATDARETSSSNRIKATTLFRKLGHKTIEVSGSVSAPILSAAVRRLSPELGIYLTASHRPKDWIGLKAKDRAGLPIPSVAARKITALYPSLATRAFDYPIPPSERITWRDALEMYVAELQRSGCCGTNSGSAVSIISKSSCK